MKRFTKNIAIVSSLGTAAIATGLVISHFNNHQSNQSHFSAISKNASSGTNNTANSHIDVTSLGRVAEISATDSKHFTVTENKPSNSHWNLEYSWTANSQPFKGDLSDLNTFLSTYNAWNNSTNIMEHDVIKNIKVQIIPEANYILDNYSNQPEDIEWTNGADIDVEMDKLKRVVEFSIPTLSSHLTISSGKVTLPKLSSTPNNLHIVYEVYQTSGIAQENLFHSYKELTDFLEPYIIPGSTDPRDDLRARYDIFAYYEVDDDQQYTLDHTYDSTPPYMNHNLKDKAIISHSKYVDYVASDFQVGIDGVVLVNSNKILPGTWAEFRVPGGSWTKIKPDHMLKNGDTLEIRICSDFSYWANETILTSLVKNIAPADYNIDFKRDHFNVVNVGGNLTVKHDYDMSKMPLLLIQYEDQNNFKTDNWLETPPTNLKDGDKFRVRLGASDDDLKWYRVDFPRDVIEFRVLDHKLKLTEFEFAGKDGEGTIKFTGTLPSDLKLRYMVNGNWVDDAPVNLSNGQKISVEAVPIKDAEKYFIFPNTLPVNVKLASDIKANDLIPVNSVSSTKMDWKKITGIAGGATAILFFTTGLIVYFKRKKGGV